MIFLIKNLILIFFTVISTNSIASVSTKLMCSYKHGIKTIEITTNEKTFISRRVLNDYQISLFIKDTSNPNEIDDYIEIKDFKGHNVIFLMKCRKM